MTPIAFDVATKTGYAYRAATGWCTGVLCPMDTAKLAAVLRTAVEAGVDVAVLEDCFLSQLHGNVRTYGVLKACQERIKVSCEFLKLPAVRVAAVTWQAGWGIGGKREQRKEHAMMIARTLTHGAALTQDEADAVCLSEWYRLSKRDEIRIEHGGATGRKMSKKTTRSAR